MTSPTASPRSRWDWDAPWLTADKCLTFCPRYPRNLVQFSSVEDILANSQTEFWALDLERRLATTCPGHLHEVRFGLDVAEVDGTLAAGRFHLFRDNEAVYDGLSRPGARIVSFAPMLKHGHLPSGQPFSKIWSKLAKTLSGNPVEIEFAVRLARGERRSLPSLASCRFARSPWLATIRTFAFDAVEPEQLICQSTRFWATAASKICTTSSSSTRSASSAAAARRSPKPSRTSMRSLTASEPSLSADWSGALGIERSVAGNTVEWDEISGARVIVEAGFRDFRVTPSQGSHFFQNLTAFQIGYFTVNPDAGEGSLDWDWLARAAGGGRTGMRPSPALRQPFRVIMNSRTSQGIILKPAANYETK